jgi:hypothetical protein
MTPFPTCLQKPDLAGKARSRTPDTKAKYRKRYAGMERTLARTRLSAVSVVDVIEDVRSRAKELRKRSYYVYRAVILQHLRDLFKAGSLNEGAVEALVARMMPDGGTASIGTQVSEVRTSAKSRKHVKPESFGTLTSMAYAKGSRTYDIVGGLLEYGPEVLTRPCELLGAKLDGRQLSVRSAKWSPANEKGIGEIRRIGLMDAIPDWELPEFHDLLVLLREDLNAVDGDRTRLVRRYGAALRELRKGESWAEGITLKSTRSQGRATLARAGYTAAEIASIMGHASAETSASHYGKAADGWKLPPDRYPLVISEQALAKVRPGARTKSKRARCEPVAIPEEPSEPPGMKLR